MVVKYPINYDFGGNWLTKIVPVLDNPKIMNSIKRGINAYLRNFPNCKKKFQLGTVPSSYSSKDNDKRLENHMFGDKIPKKKIDKTLGGKFAFLDSAEDAYDNI